MAKQQFFTIPVSQKYSGRERKAIAQEVLDFVIERTKKGKDKNNSPFPKYGKDYIGSQDFKIAGKSKKVNLTLSGDMLDEMTHLSRQDTVRKLALGYIKSDKAMNGQVEGNVLGTYGNKSPIPGKERDFMGISKKDLNAILDNYPIETKKDKVERLARTKIVERATREGEDVVERFELIDEFEAELKQELGE